MHDICNKTALEMIKYFDGDLKRINHALKVESFARIIAKGENTDERQLNILCLTAILHDIGIKEAERKYGRADGPIQEKEGPPVAEDILKGLGIPNDITERVCYIIGHHHTYDSIDGLDYQILIEADFIVNIYEDNLSIDSIKTIYEKFFKTKTGKQLIKYLYKLV